MKKLILAHKIPFAVIGIQLLLVFVLLVTSIITPRENLVLSSAALSSDKMEYVSIQNNALVYAIPYHSEYASSPFSLGSGAYIVQVSYTTEALAESFASTQSTKATYATDCLDISSAAYSTAVLSSPIELTEGATYATGRIWIQPLWSLDDLQVTMYYTGTCAVAVESITLTESMTYRLFCCLALGFLFLCIDVLYWVFAKKRDALPLQKCLAVLIATICFACLPLFCNFNIWGHDYYFHLARITSVAEELANGQFPVRMMTGMVNGYGHPNSIFYCDLFLYIPAILYNCMVPLYVCYQIYLWMVTILTAGIAYFAFQKITKLHSLAFIGTVLYLLSSYRLSCVYTRASLGEYSAMAFFPLVLAGVYVIFTEEKPQFKDWVLLTLGMAGVIHSHVLSSEILVIFLILFCLVLCTKTLKKHRFFALVKATLTTALLSAWFIVPFLSSISDSIYAFSEEKVSASIQAHGLYLAQLFSVFTTSTGLSNTGAYAEMPLSLGFALTIGLGCAIYCVLHRHAWQLAENHDYQALRLSLPFALLACAFTLYAFPWDFISAALGDTIGGLFLTIQFSWRYLSVATLLSTVTALFALKLIRTFDTAYYKPLICAMLAFTVLTTGYYYTNLLNESAYDASTIATYDITMDITGHHYLLTGTSVNLFASANPSTESDDVLVLDYQTEGGKKYLSVTNLSKTVQSVTFPVQNYSNYHVYDSTMKEFEISNGANNNICVDLPAGYSGTLVLRYEPPMLWHIAEMISLLTALLIFFCASKGYLPRRKKVAKPA